MSILDSGLLFWTILYTVTFHNAKDDSRIWKFAIYRIHCIIEFQILHCFIMGIKLISIRLNPRF